MSFKENSYEILKPGGIEIVTLPISVYKLPSFLHKMKRKIRKIMLMYDTCFVTTVVIIA